MEWLKKIGQFFSKVASILFTKADVDTFGETSISGSFDAVTSFANLLTDGFITPKQWHDMMREEIKAEYIRQYLAGIGGVEQMTAKNWGSVGGMIADQYRYLLGFYEEVQVGNLSVEQIISRSKMYINSSREALSRAQELVAKAVGNDQEKWNLGAVMTEHCTDCVGYDSMGWQPVGTFPYPGDGSTECVTGCQCVKEYRNSGTGQEYGGLTLTDINIDEL